MTFPLDPRRPADGYAGFRADALSRAGAQRPWTPADGPLPALFLSHGVPTALNDDAWLRQLLAWSLAAPRPRGIVIVSAHWENAPLALSSPGARTPLVYDFGGLHESYYQLRYATPDAAGLTRRIAAVLPAGEPVHQHPGRGLDHGAWVPLMAMYPGADVPVLQMSIPSHDPARLVRLGSALAALRDEGVLVIGSGFLTHGTPFMTREMFVRGTVPAWSSEFDAWAAEALARGDLDELAAYQTRAPGMPYAHPTPDHFLPIFVALGAGGFPDRPAGTFLAGYMLGFAQRSFQVG
jgi:4,5-DOPA dioxygenase extradiol